MVRLIVHLGHVLSLIQRHLLLDFGLVEESLAFFPAKQSTQVEQKEMAILVVLVRVHLFQKFEQKVFCE